MNQNKKNHNESEDNSFIETVAEARLRLKENLPNGLKCPVCGQFAKLYHRQINMSMSMAIIVIAKQQRLITNPSLDPWVDVTKMNLRGGDYGKLRWWGLLEKRDLREDEAEDKKSSGRWRCTEKGLLFVRNQIEVPKFVYIYDNRKCGESAEMTNIAGTITKRFNYKELMEWHDDNEKEKLKDNVEI